MNGISKPLPPPRPTFAIETETVWTRQSKLADRLMTADNHTINTKQTKNLNVMSKTNKLAMLPVMLCFFAMGFVDLVGIASNYVKDDLHLTDSTANVFPSLVFFWFLIFRREC